MPLYRDLVEVGKSPFGKPQIFCAHCHRPAEYMPETGLLEGIKPLSLMCPSGVITLGDGWVNEQQRSSEIAAFLDRTPQRKI